MAFIGFEIIALLLPGHNEGSMCYLVNGHCFTGDTIFIGRGGSCSETEANDLCEFVQYVKKRLNRNMLMWPGHSFGLALEMEFGYLVDTHLYFQLDEKDLFRNFINSETKFFKLVLGKYFSQFSVNTICQDAYFLNWASFVRVFISSPQCSGSLRLFFENLDSVKKNVADFINQLPQEGSGNSKVGTLKY